ncbi:MAG TPA: penicillin-binding protein activator [Allosphingosinicella sp.]|jgi:ABC-type branched-subunit amino acid transport system substrate-binding protein|nr:penicillin-binding protein activator [Allosphingosinicella sp.]
MAELSPGSQARRYILGAGAAALLAMSLAGCQLVPKPRPDLPPEDVPPEVERPREEEPGPQLPPDETRNRVAVLVPTSGSNAGVGQSIANAANLALLDAGGERIRITVYDTARAGAAEAANRALAEGNGLFLGPLLAEDVRAVAPVARRARVPVIAFSNDSSVAGDGVYLMGFTPGQSIARVVAHARGAGLDRFGVLAPAGVYGRRASDAMVAAVEDSGGRLLAMQTFEGLASIRPAVARLYAQGDYDAVLIGDGGRGAATAAPLLKSGPNARVRLLGTELWASETTLGRTPALRGAWYASVGDSMFNQLRTRYRARYGANPYRLASLGYDAVLLTVRIAKNWRLGRAFPERELRDPVGFAGVDGAFRFAPSGIAERSLEVREVTATGTIVVSPAPRSFD